MTHPQLRHHLLSYGKMTIVTVAGVVAFLLLVDGTKAPETPLERKPPTAANKGALVAAAAASTVYRNPATGKLGPPPVGFAQQLPDGDIAYSTSSRGLVEVSSPVAGGGVMVRLKGRFRHAMRATVDAEGNVSTDCGAAPGEKE